MKKPRNTDICFTVLLIALIASYMWHYFVVNNLPESGGSAEESMWLAAVLAVSALLGVISCAGELMLLYYTWDNVLQLPRSEKESGWQPSPVVAVLPLLVPVFSAVWAFVAYGRLPRLAELRTGRPLMPAPLMPVYLCCSLVATLCSVALPWLIRHEILPEPSYDVGILLTGLNVLCAVLFLLVAWYLTVFNRHLASTPTDANPVTM